jgi:hypothetical protein
MYYHTSDCYINNRKVMLLYFQKSFEPINKPTGISIYFCLLLIEKVQYNLNAHYRLSRSFKLLS